VLRRFSHGNNLGDQPLQFMVASGTYTAQLAAQRGLCKPEQCDVFAQLNPYQRYSNGWDELIRQGYALGDIQAWSASSGTVVIPRAAMPPSPTAEASTRVSFSHADGAAAEAGGGPSASHALEWIQ